MSMLTLSRLGYKQAVKSNDEHKTVTNVPLVINSNGVNSFKETDMKCDVSHNSSLTASQSFQDRR